MEVPVSNGHHEKRCEKLLTENGDCTFLARPKYKRRKVSAIRDFPEHCGPYASRVEPALKVNGADYGSANGTIVVENGQQLGGDAGETSNFENDPRHSELKNNSYLSENPGQATECSLNEENPIVSSCQGDDLIENVQPAKVPLVDMETMGDDLLENGQPAKVPLVDMETVGDDLIENGQPAKVPLVDMETVGDDLIENGQPAKVTLVDVETVDSEFPRNGDPVKCESSDMLKSTSPAVEVAWVEDAVFSKGLPQRKVSAVRDFPPFCGRDAPRLSKKVSQQDLTLGDNPLKKLAAVDGNRVESKVEDEYGCKGKLVDTSQTDYEMNAKERVKKLKTSVMKTPLENTREKYIMPPEKGSNCYQVKNNSKLVKKDKRDDVLVDKKTSQLEIVVNPEVLSPETKPIDVSNSQQKLKGGLKRLKVSSNREVVLGLMAKSEWPLTSESNKGSSKDKLIDGTDDRKGKKVDYFPGLDRSKSAVKKTKGGLNHSGQKPLKRKKGNAASEGVGALAIVEKKDFLDTNENIEDLQVIPKSRFNITVPPFGHSNSTGHENDSNVTRNKVRETLRLFQAVSRKLLHEVESKLNERSHNKRVDLQAAKILKEKGKYVNTGKQILGSVPGVEVGDEFQYRVELNIVGLHRLTQGGIDYVKHNGKILATSIVASGAYADELDNSDVLTYSGQGGNVMNTGKEPEDQKLERGNLALKNSSEEKNPVRVIRGSESADGRSKSYVYDGLYLVESCWQDMGPHGKLIYRFRLRRISGQPELALREVKKSKKFKTREGLCVDDISYGKERIPICAVNTIDDEKPPPFNYITSMIYPNCHLVPAEGCNCFSGCSDLEKCSCVIKNGGELPFNHNAAIVEAKPLVYECGPSCKCPSTCHNRVSQLGIQFQLEIFKTQERGWGVRSLNSIPSGSFICEYIGELLEEKEAEERTGNDEYLFDIGNNYSSSALWDGLSSLMPDALTSSREVVKDGGGFTIDAAQFGNVGRFINHSCSPNLYAQNVLYDHHDTRMPHIMFFAAENIPPLQELSYDYNYKIDQVFDSQGNVKKKYCHCGSAECTGRMY